MSPRAWPAEFVFSTTVAWQTSQTLSAAGTRSPDKRRIPSASKYWPGARPAARGARRTRPLRLVQHEAPAYETTAGQRSERRQNAGPVARRHLPWVSYRPGESCDVFGWIAQLDDPANRVRAAENL